MEEEGPGAVAAAAAAAAWREDRPAARRPRRDRYIGLRVFSLFPASGGLSLCGKREHFSLPDFASAHCDRHSEQTPPRRFHSLSSSSLVPHFRPPPPTTDEYLNRLPHFLPLNVESCVDFISFLIFFPPSAVID